VKEEYSNSWFICVNKILRKYDLKEAYNYLDNPIKNSPWISLVKSRVNDHCCTQLTTLAQLYKGLQYLTNHNKSKSKIHPILKHRCYSSLDISRIPVKLRLVTGTYVLQAKRIKYYRNETDPACLLCGAAEENILHFILQCEKLQSERVALLSEINSIWQNEFQNNENFTDLSEVDQLQLLRDRPFNLKVVFRFVQNFFFGQHKTFPEFNIRLYDKNSESDYFFSSTKIRIFFSATLGIRIFF
jgi:hypothetical protein